MLRLEALYIYLSYAETPFISLLQQLQRAPVHLDIENVKAVYNLVKVRGFKLAAACKILRENKQDIDNNARLMESLIHMRDELK